MKISTPGRICLFGEHQDYLGLPVIAAAISKRIAVDGYKRNDIHVNIELPNINSRVSFLLSETKQYATERDYFKSGINVLVRNGFSFNYGFDCIVEGDIPINSGTSSSSALLVSWLGFLVKMSDIPRFVSPEQIAFWAYQAEVEEFDEAGGMMDHYSTACGNVIYLASQPKIEVEFLKPNFGTFVLGDSLQPKDTVGVLKWVKGGMIEILNKIKGVNANFNLQNVNSLEISEYRDLLSKSEMMLLKGNIDDKLILEKAYSMFKDHLIDEDLGDLLNQHHHNLTTAKKVSTPKIDAMIEAAIKAGALGAKINGSGGGGCMFAYAPNDPDKVASAIEKAGGKAYLIGIDEGTKEED